MAMVSVFPSEWALEFQSDWHLDWEQASPWVRQAALVSTARLYSPQSKYPLLVGIVPGWRWAR